MWYDAEHFPSSWRLDPTEGPDRVRCRLQRYHLDVDEKYLMEDCRGKSEWKFGSFCFEQSVIVGQTFPHCDCTERAKGKGIKVGGNILREDVAARRFCSEVLVIVIVDFT